jgi:hypothetical protein
LPSIAANHREDHEARRSGREGDGGDGLQQPFFSPRLQDLLGRERRYDGDAQTVEISFRTQPEGSKGEKRKEEAGHDENQGDGPVVRSLAPSTPHVSGRRSLAKAGFEVIFPLRKQREFGPQAQDPRLVRELDLLPGILAEAFRIADDLFDALGPQCFTYVPMAPLHLRERSTEPPKQREFNALNVFQQSCR